MTDYPIQPVKFHPKFHLADSFGVLNWSIKSAEVSIPTAFTNVKSTAVWVISLPCRRSETGEHQGDFPWTTPNIYKVVEGASYVLVESAIRTHVARPYYLDSYKPST